MKEFLEYISPVFTTFIDWTTKVFNFETYSPPTKIIMGILGLAPVIIIGIGIYKKFNKN